MSFVIKNVTNGKLNPELINDLKTALDNKIRQSRFTAEIRIKDGRKPKITIHNIRLKKAKHYCGNHPLPCPVRPYHTPHKKLIYLEGTDWVAFNDGLNDLLDDLKISADVGSSLVVIRQKTARCVEYKAQLLSNNIDNEWTKYGVYKDCIGEAHKPAIYPTGTPGEYRFEN